MLERKSVIFFDETNSIAFFLTFVKEGFGV